MPEHLQHATLVCPRSLVGRLIGRGGTTVKGIQLFTGTVVEIVQSTEPAIITIVGPAPEHLSLAENIIRDIINGRFKGFALLRELVQKESREPNACGQDRQKICRRQLAYAPGFGLLPERQVGQASIARLLHPASFSF